jgi:hypothetical protein
MAGFARILRSTFWPAAAAAVLIPGSHSTGARSPAPAASALSLAMQDTDDEARRQFDIWTAYAVPAGAQQRFNFSTAYPSAQPPARRMPWDNIDFKRNPEQYLRQVLAYCLTDAEADDFVFGSNSRWFHTPWLAREPLRGLTSERPSEAGELWPRQPDGI